LRLPRSLRLRLLLGGAVWILVALLASWIFIVMTFASLIDAERRADLQASLDRIIGEIDPDATEPVPEGALRDPRYDTPLSGVYWQVEDTETGEMMRSRSLWDAVLPRGGADGRAALTQVSAPGGAILIVLNQIVRVARRDGTERALAVAVAEERDAGAEPVRYFALTLALFLAALAATLFGAALLQVRLGLQPFSLLQRGIAAVRDGAAERLPEPDTVELKPVAAQINELLDAQDTTLSFVRQRAADLAHGLKTPLAVMAATADRLRAQGDTENGAVLEMLTEQMNARIDYQLRIARLRFRTRAHGVHASVNEAVLRSVAVLRKSHEGERINWVVEFEDGLEADIDPHDLMELIGVLLENAARWANRQVVIRGIRYDGHVGLTVEDDGDGLTDDQIRQLGQRGVRLDERSEGTGLGLAIAFEIARLNGGVMNFGRSASGGLSARVELVAGPTGSAAG
jgi:signal transduction histidine kinase